MGSRHQILILVSLLPAMTNACDFDQQFTIIDRVDHPIVTDAPLAIAALAASCTPLNEELMPNLVCGPRVAQ